MRELKFRAWNKDEKFMEELSWPWAILEGKIYSVETGAEWGNIILMQYTNRKDKNGKEIYDSDLVKYRCKGSLMIGKVYFAHGCWKIKEVQGGNAMYLYKASSVEVIGNIWENPELLEKK